MDDLDVVHIFLGGIARMSHVPDHIPGGHHAALLKPLSVGIVLAQVGVIIISLLVKASDPDTPAAVLIPAKGLHIAGLHGNHRGSHLSHHVMSQMGPGVAVASRRAEVIGIRIGKGGRNGRKGFKPVFSPPYHVPLPILLLQEEFSHHPAKNRLIGLFIIGIRGKPFRFLLQTALAGLKPPCRIFQIRQGPASEFSAVPCGGTGEKADPVHVGIAAVGVQIRFVGQLKSLAGNVEIHPSDVIL